MNDSIRTFVKSLEKREFSKTTRQKFWDGCELAYCALAKQATYVEEAEALEARYMQIVGTYQDKDAVRAYPELLALVYHEVMAGRDLLGPVAAEIGVLDNSQGQFFTPYEVCSLMARQLFGLGVPEIETTGFVTVDEPASGLEPLATIGALRILMPFG